MNKEQMVVNAIRILSAEAVQKAKSGHPGMPMGAAAMAYAVWGREMTHNPADPKFVNRDRFVLSSGHGSMNRYTYSAPVRLRPDHRRPQGLPSVRLQDPPATPSTSTPWALRPPTGPLGQGIANAVGMAMAEKHLAAKFNREGFNVVDHYTYCILGDGCMMEGISHEACSLAGTLKLNKLIALYDDNEISIEGNTDIAFREDVPARFRAYGWNVIDVKNGNCYEEVDAAIRLAKDSDKPNLIVCHTAIGYGSPQGRSGQRARRASGRGEPRGDQEEPRLAGDRALRRAPPASTSRPARPPAAARKRRRNGTSCLPSTPRSIPN